MFGLDFIGYYFLSSIITFKVQSSTSRSNPCENEVVSFLKAKKKKKRDVGHGSDSHVRRFLGGSATKASYSNKFNTHTNAVRSLNKISIPYTCLRLMMCAHVVVACPIEGLCTSAW